MKYFKVKLYAFIFLLVQIFPLQAALISRHNEQHTAQQAAEDFLSKKGCIKFKTTRTKQYEALDEGVADQVKVTMPELTVACVTYFTEKPGKLLLTWTNATTREDGSALLLSDIRGVKIMLDGKLIALAVGNQFELDAAVVPYGSPIKLRTLDTNGLESKDAPVIWD